MVEKERGLWGIVFAGMLNLIALRCMGLSASMETVVSWVAELEPMTVWIRARFVFVFGRNFRFFDIKFEKVFSIVVGLYLSSAALLSAISLLSKKPSTTRCKDSDVLHDTSLGVLEYHVIVMEGFCARDATSSL